MSRQEHIYANEAKADRDEDELMFDCERGEAYRTWVRNALEHCRGKFASQNKSERYSFRDAYMRKDEGGTAQGAPALPPQQVNGNNNPAHTAAVNNRQVRQQSAYAWLYAHITSDAMRELLSDLASNDPNELAGDAWDLIRNECDEPDDDLELTKMDREWASSRGSTCCCSRGRTARSRPCTSRWCRSAASRPARRCR